MKHAVMTAVAFGLAATVLSAPVEAGQFGNLTKKVKEIKREAEKVERAAEDIVETAETVEAIANGRTPASSSSNHPSYPKTASRGDWAGRAAPAPARYASMTKCANLKQGNAFIAKAGDYTFSQGLSTESRSGLVEREPVQVSNGCVLPPMGSGDVLYLEVDRGAYKKHAYRMQCVSYDGSQQLDNTNAPPANNYTGKDVMLHTGNSLGYEPTATGSNSQRSGKYDEWLAGRGREMITVNMPNLHTDKAGTDFYCQYFNKDSGESALAFSFRRGPVHRP